MPFAATHLSNAIDLVTPYENTRAGFVQMALEKNFRATPFVAEARDLAEKSKQAARPADLLIMPGIRGALLTASGISEKASWHIDQIGQKEAIHKFVENYLEPAGNSFREELIYRFLLTRGDSLGGAMRNIVGALAERRFNSMLFARLSNAGLQAFYRLSMKSKWLHLDNSLSSEILGSIKSVAWKNDFGERVLMYNAKIRIVDKNIDMSLLAATKAEFLPAILNDSMRFLALGELKGGNDPAGADEHWKTANSALTRIRNNFAAANYSPNLFSWVRLSNSPCRKKYGNNSNLVTWQTRLI